MSTTFTLSVGTAKQIDNATAYPVSEANAADFQRVYAHLAGQKNTAKMELDGVFATDAAAEDYRQQIKSWCASKGYTAYLPKYVPEHTVNSTDKATGKVTTKVVPANGTPKHFNNGTNVTFRITLPEPKATPAPVTTTQAAA